MQHRVFIVILAFSIAGCDLFGESGQDCGASLPSPSAGTYTLRVDQGQRCRVYTNERMEVNPTAVDRGIRPVILFDFDGIGERGIDLYMAIRGQDSLAEKEFAVADLLNADPPYPGKFETYEGRFSVAGMVGSEHLDRLLSRSGTVTITRFDQDYVKGTLDVVLQIDGSSDQWDVSGQFSAKVARNGWMTVW